jgi:hypothetical protein
MRLPSNHEPRDYQGLILASKESYAEFKSEAIRSTKKFHADLERQWQGLIPLQITPPTRLRHLTQLGISIVKESIFPRSVLKTDNLNDLPTFLLDRVSQFILYIYKPANGPAWNDDRGNDLTPRRIERRIRFNDRPDRPLVFWIQGGKSIMCRSMPVSRRYVSKFGKTVSRGVFLDRSCEVIVYCVHRV